VILFSSIILGGFYYAKEESITKNNSVENSKIDNDIEVKIEKLISNRITSQGEYSLNCSSVKYTAINIGGSIITESSINISKGNEKQVLYIENEKVKYFGADYHVIQDDENFLVILRAYEVSGLTEVVSISKETGIGFDTNTKVMGLTGGPTTASYLISCS
jgi:hypothetical protein